MQTKKRGISFIKSLNLKVDSSIDNVLKENEYLRLLTPLKIGEVQSRNLPEEFEILNKLTLGLNHQTRLINKSEFKSLNRYRNILAYEDSLVKLNDSDILTSSNYINANYIHHPYRNNSRNNFIATQGPLEETCGHFWQMVKGSKAGMVVAIIEKNSLGSRCHEYWPATRPVKKCGDYLISEKDRFESAFLDLKAFKVENQVTKTSHEVNHAHLHNWIDHSALGEEDFDNFVDFVKMMYYHFQDSKDTPIVVHCSAGIGRTGTLIASYYLYERWVRCQEQQKEFSFSVFGLVRHLREQRYGAVQTFEQYAFLYEIVRHFGK